jgi:hypothetical protein
LAQAQAQAQMLGADFWTHLDRRRDDAAGEALSAVATPGVDHGGESGGAVRPGPGGRDRGGHRGGLLPARRRAVLRAGTATIDLDGTDLECYGLKKDGIAYTYKGQRAGRPHVACWAEAGLVTAADLLAGDEDPRPGAGGLIELIERSVATLRAAGVTARPRVRGDVGYFAKDIAWAAVTNGCDFSLGITRNPAAWRAAAAIAADAWTEAIGMTGAQVAVADYAPSRLATRHRLRGAAGPVAAADISTDPRARRRRTIPKDQLTLALDGAVEQRVRTLIHRHQRRRVHPPAKAATVEAWHRLGCTGRGQSEGGRVSVNWRAAAQVHQKSEASQATAPSRSRNAAFPWHRNGSGVRSPVSLSPPCVTVSA